MALKELRYFISWVGAALQAPNPQPIPYGVNPNRLFMHPHQPTTLGLTSA